MIGQTPQVALSLDLDNLLRALPKTYEDGRIAIEAIWQQASQYGHIRHARAVADFSMYHRHLKRSLEIRGIQAINVEPRRIGNTLKSSVDMALVVNVFEMLLDDPAVDTIVIGSGDSDFVHLITHVRRYWNKVVVVIGVPGATSRDSAESCNIFDPLVLPEVAERQEQAPALRPATSGELEAAAIQLLDVLRQRPPAPFLNIARHIRETACLGPLSDRQIRRLLNTLVAAGILQQQLIKRDDGTETRVMRVVDKPTSPNTALPCGHAASSLAQ